jgi:hypothetical protein
MAHIDIEGTTVSTGMILTANEKAAGNDICPAGMQAQVFRFKIDHGRKFVGMNSMGHKLSRWHNLDGHLPDHTGYWFEGGELFYYFDMFEVEAQITKDFVFKGVNLAGKTGKILANLEGGFQFVELEEDVGGCSADGLGKAGHCVAVHKTTLKLKQKSFVKEKGKEG